MQALFKRPDTWFVVVIFLLMIPAERLELFSASENQLHGLRHLVRWSTLPRSETGFPIDKILIVDTDEVFFEFAAAQQITAVLFFGFWGAAQQVTPACFVFPSDDALSLCNGKQ